MGKYANANSDSPSSKTIYASICETAVSWIAMLILQRRPFSLLTAMASFTEGSDGIQLLMPLVNKLTVDHSILVARGESDKRPVPVVLLIVGSEYETGNGWPVAINSR
ncbi:hypothetical protein OIU76_020482 [Salix suchowensis]|uniref:Uncharacterized protein n=1 Tax=Salix suchowensis TaxID=1278906 RepID=A0ABQ8ZMA8_9ROSI|nr:hypothetical protein OIU76_020482 [Salix suchowensis]KAJ6303018.1 hypothetical protein OIU77_016992 [Salix suchowensis]